MTEKDPTNGERIKSEATYVQSFESVRVVTQELTAQAAQWNPYELLKHGGFVSGRHSDEMSGRAADQRAILVRSPDNPNIALYVQKGEHQFGGLFTLITDENGVIRTNVIEMLDPKSPAIKSPYMLPAGTTLDFISEFDTSQSPRGITLDKDGSAQATVELYDEVSRLFEQIDADAYESHRNEQARKLGSGVVGRLKKFIRGDI